MKPGPKKQVVGEDSRAVVAVPGMPPIPKGLDKDGKPKWLEITHALDKLGLLSATDVDVIHQFCVLYARWTKAERVIASTGMTYETGNGMRRPVPEIQISNDCSKQMKALLEAMALTPSSRSRVNAPGEDTQVPEEWKEFE